jgi:hypothetical protein
VDIVPVGDREAPFVQLDWIPEAQPSGIAAAVEKTAWEQYRPEAGKMPVDRADRAREQSTATIAHPMRVSAWALQPSAALSWRSSRTLC